MSTFLLKWSFMIKGWGKNVCDKNTLCALHGITQHNSQLLHPSKHDNVT